MSEKLPDIKVRFESGRRYNYWLTEACPFCGEEHQHGAGGPGEPLLLMSRVPHCHGDTGNYELVADMQHGPTRAAVKQYGLLAPRGFERNKEVCRAK